MLWLWHRLAAVVPIRPLAWELPYASTEVLKSKKKGRKGRREGGRIEREVDDRGWKRIMGDVMRGGREVLDDEE